MNRAGRDASARAVAALLALFSCAALVAGQTPPQARRTSGAADLDRVVSVSLESATVGQLAAELSKQTGVAIEAGPAIQARIVTAELKGITGRQALDALASTYDWRWYRAMGRYVLDRQTFRPAADPTAIPALMQAALPVDIRALLQVPDLKTKAPKEHTSVLARIKVGPAAARALGRLKESLAETLERQDRIPVRDLTQAQREDLLTWLVFGDILRSLELLHDDPAPHRVSPDRFVLRIEKLCLDVDTSPDVKPGFGFGTQIVRPDGTPLR